MTVDWRRGGFLSVKVDGVPQPITEGSLLSIVQDGDARTVRVDSATEQPDGSWAVDFTTGHMFYDLDDEGETVSRFVADTEAAS